VQSLSAAQWVKFGGTGYDVPFQLHTASHKYRNSLLGGRGWTGFINDLESYPHCDWLKTSYSANKVTFCKYAARNQLGTPGGAKSFLRDPKFLNYIQYFQTISNTFFQGGQKIF